MEGLKEGAECEEGKPAEEEEGREDGWEGGSGMRKGRKSAEEGSDGGEGVRGGRSEGKECGSGGGQGG